MAFTAGCENRKSRDCTVNGNGKRFMEFCKKNGLIILNGQTKGDEEGNLTFVGGMGCSVNDICSVSQDILYMVDSFAVKSQVWSDHMPIVLGLVLKKSEPKEKANINLLPKLMWKDSMEARYKENIDRKLNEIKTVKQELDLKDIINIISGAASAGSGANKQFIKKEKWYDIRCEKFRKRSCKALQTFNETRTVIDKDKYMAANKQYKATCEKSRKKYLVDLEIRINEVKDSKGWWALAKEIRGSQSYNETTIDANKFKDYFKELLNPTQTAKDIQYAAMKVEVDSLDRRITTEEVIAMLNKTKPNKAPGLDRTPYEFFKYASNNLQEQLATIYDRIYNTGTIDESFITNLLFPIFKKGDKKVVRNYRGISFMNCVAKVLMGVLNTRLVDWVEENGILKEFQAGFRKNYSTVDNIYNLASIAHIKFNERKKVYAFFVDFKAAFDKVPRKLLIYKLHAMGISTKFVNFIEKIYQKSSSIIWSGNNISEQFETTSGVKQGCLLSPMLFALYLNDLHAELGGGLLIDKYNIRLLLYADDIVLLSDDIYVLRKMIQNLERYCEKWNMEVNLEKSAIMVFRQGGKLGKEEKWQYRGKEIIIVNEYCYLGVLLTPKMSFKKHFEKKNNAAIASINSLWNSFFRKKKIDLSAKWKMFQAVCRAIQSYAAQVWGHGLFEDVDKLHLHFIKKIFKLPDCAPSYAIYLDTGLEQGHIYTLSLHLKYIHKTLFEYKNERLPHILSNSVLKRKIFWVRELNKIGNAYDLRWDDMENDSRKWNEKCEIMLNSINSTNKEKMWRSAMNSTDRIFKLLDHNIGHNYFRDDLNRYRISLIFKARSGCIMLNGLYKKNCPICNLNEIETIQHFLGRCPILKFYRYVAFGKNFLDQSEVVQALNGIDDPNWNNLTRFVIGALRCRKFILDE